MRELAGVIFDLGDVFYDATRWRKWLTAELGRLGVDVSYGDLVSRWEHLLEDVYRGHVEYWERFSVLLGTLGVPDATVPGLVQAARSYGRKAADERVLFPGVAEVLSALRARGMKLGILSDTESGEVQVRELLRSLGIEGYFDAVVASRDIGHVKPEARAYQAAAAAIELPLTECAFVGHDADELQGARAVGMFTIAYNDNPRAPADANLGHLTELPGLVAKATRVLPRAGEGDSQHRQGASPSSEASR